MNGAGHHVQAGCGPKCWATPTCRVCGRPKLQRGRYEPSKDVCQEAACDGWDAAPKPGHLWEPFYHA